MKTIRFFSIWPRTGEVRNEYGTVTLDDAGELHYSDDIVRDIMAAWVGKFGVEQAFAYFSDWGNGESGSQLVEA